MYPHLTARQLDVLHIQVEEHKASLLSWLETIDSHMYWLYLISGNDTCLMILPVTNRLRERMTMIAENSSDMIPEMQELAKSLSRITLLLNVQVDQSNAGGISLPNPS